MLTALRAARDGDRGSIAVFTAVFAFSVLLLLGVLVDGGNALTARERAADVAEQAARAAVTDLSIENLHASQATTSPSPSTSPGASASASPSTSPSTGTGTTTGPSTGTGTTTGTGAETVAIDWTTACTYAQQTVTDYAASEGDVTAVTMTKCGEGADPLTATVTVTVTTKPAIPVPGFDSPMTMTATQSATAECGNADQQEVC